MIYICLGKPGSQPGEKKKRTRRRQERASFARAKAWIQDERPTSSLPHNINFFFFSLPSSPLFHIFLPVCFLESLSSSWCPRSIHLQLLSVHLTIQAHTSPRQRRAILIMSSEGADATANIQTNQDGIGACFPLDVPFSLFLSVGFDLPLWSTVVVYMCLAMRICSY